MTTPHDPTRSFSPLDAVIAEYLQAVEAGQAPDRPALIALHLEMADSLMAFFDDLDRMNRVASPLGMTYEGETIGDLEATLLPAPEVIRYFGDYELLQEVARGGMGVVYKARQESLNRVVALKMVLAGAFASAKDVQRFRIEAEAAANLDHPHIVPIYEVGEHEGQQYFSMKFVEGTSLAAHSRGSAREEILGLLDVARAVHHAHQRGVLHRDLKPSNVLVDFEGLRLVTDFGLAKRLSDVDGSLTETGQLLGTPRYMSPEQALGRKDLTVTADVYSLGVILFERLTGRTPFLADNVVSLLHQVRESEPPRLSSITPGLGRDLETIVGKCLDKIPSRRYTTAEALALDLENWLEGRPIAARPVGPPARAWRWCKRNPAVAALMATVAASLLAGTIVSIAFALRAEARAVEAGISATRARLLIARNLTNSVDDPLESARFGLLTYARAFRQVPVDRSADDLRWFICANLTVLGQQFHNLLPPLEGGEIAIKVDALSPDGRTYAALSPEGRLRIWDVLTGKLKTTFLEDRRGVRTLRFSPDGRLIAAIQVNSTDFNELVIYGGKGMLIPANSPADGRPRMRIWDLAANREGPSIDLDEGFRGEEFSPDHRYVALRYSSDNAKEAKSHLRNRCVLIETSQGRRIVEFVGLVSYPYPRFTPDSRALILNGDEDETVILTAEGGRERYRFKAENVISSHSGRELAVVRGDQVHFLETESGKAVRPPAKFGFTSNPPHSEIGGPSNFAFSDDDRFLVVGNNLVELATARKEDISQISTDWIFPTGSSLAFSSDGRRAIDLTNLHALPRPIDGRFHPELANRMAPNRLFFPDDGPSDGSRISELWDLKTELAFTKGVSLANGGEIFPVDGGSILSRGEKMGPLNSQTREVFLDPVFFMPIEVLSDNPEVIELWAEVLSRHRLIEETNSQKLDEAEWERRRRRLIEILPKSPSPILTLVANDRLHWLRREVIEEITNKSINTKILISRWSPYREHYDEKDEREAKERDRKIGLLSRLIDAEPRWWVREYRGMALAKQGRTDAAASDIAAVARAAGDWYWEIVPPILDVPTMDRLLLSEEPAAVLRDQRKLGPEAVEVVTRCLANLSCDTQRTRSAALDALLVRSSSGENQEYL